MAIQSIPVISTTNFGGTVYGVNFSSNFSSSPSTLTLNIVNERGVYTKPPLNRQTSVSIGNFLFKGATWSYDLQESANDKTLQIQVIDNSIILDKIYVLLWKRGFLGLMGKPTAKSRTYDFSDESALLPIKRQRNNGQPFISIEEKRLGSATVTTNNSSLGSKTVGSTIIVGEEKFAESSCDIPDTWYSFSDLKAGIGSFGIRGNFPNISDIAKNTYEGTLREVLSSWCGDFGYDFVWDFTNDSLFFYDVKKGFTNIPNLNSSNIIEKTESESLEGTYAQFGISYTAKQRSAVRSFNFDYPYYITVSTSPYGIGYLSQKYDEILSIGFYDDNAGVEYGRYGAGRKREEFLECAFLGYVSPTLRDIYAFQKGYWEVLGYSTGRKSSDDDVPPGPETVPTEKMLTFLKNNGLSDMIDDYEAFDQKGLPGFQIYLSSYEEGQRNTWFNIEQELLASLGKYYQISTRPGNYFYCMSNFVAEVNMSVEPTGSQDEEQNGDFANRSIHVRDGQFSHSSQAAGEELGITGLSAEMDKCNIVHIPLKESGLFEKLKKSDIFSTDPIVQELLGRSNVIIIAPTEKFVKEKIGLNVNLTRSSNKRETTINDKVTANTANGNKRCLDFEEKLLRGGCQSAEELARKQAFKKLGATNLDNSEKNLTSGLLSKNGFACRINTSSGSVRLVAASDGAIQIVISVTVNIQKISTETDNRQYIFSNGKPQDIQNNAIAEIRILNANITDAFEDSFSSGRPKFESPYPDIIADTPLRKFKYKFAGIPPIALTPSNGLSNLDISYSSEGLTSSFEFSSRAPRLAKGDAMMNKVSSQFNRSSFS